MISLRHQLWIILPLCLAAAGVGYLLGPDGAREVHGGAGLVERVPSAPPLPPTTLFPEPVSSPGENYSNQLLERRQAFLATASTEVLWAWLRMHAREVRNNDEVDSVMEQLYLREGDAFWEKLMTSERPVDREYLSSHLLFLLADTDYRKALKLFRLGKASIHNDEWGKTAIDRIIQKAYAISTDEVIWIMEAIGYDAPTHVLVQKYADDFDFPKFISYVRECSNRLIPLPTGLIGQWAKTSPREAAELMADHFQKPDNNGSYRSMIADEMNLRESFRQIITTQAEGRNEALAALGELPMEAREKGWRETIEQQENKISPELLDAATRTGYREPFLAGILLQTIQYESLDASWSVVPLEERWRAVAEVERQMAEWDSTPQTEAVRKAWRDMVEKAWK